MTDPAPVPTPRATPRPLPKIDPDKFVGGANVERLKSMLKDVDAFMVTAKERLKDADEMFSRFKNVIGKFDDTVDLFGKIVKLNEQAFLRLLGNLRQIPDYVKDGGTDGRA